VCNDFKLSYIDRATVCARVCVCLYVCVCICVSLFVKAKKKYEGFLFLLVKT
jgi:hypothetical protein